MKENEIDIDRIKNIKSYRFPVVCDGCKDIQKLFTNFFDEFEKIKKMDNFKCFLKPFNQRPFFNFIGIHEEIEFSIVIQKPIGMNYQEILLSVFWETNEQ